VASQLIEEVTAHAQRDSLDDAREICADGTYFLNNLRRCVRLIFLFITCHWKHNGDGPLKDHKSHVCIPFVVAD
jgi:hypothetical protein